MVRFENFNFLNSPSLKTGTQTTWLHLSTIRTVLEGMNRSQIVQLQPKSTKK